MATSSEGTSTTTSRPRCSSRARVEQTLDSSAAPHHGFFIRLYTGTGAFEVIGRRKLWFAVSGLIVAIAIASIAIRGFNFGIDFEGGTKVSFPRGDATVQQVEDVFRDDARPGRPSRSSSSGTAPRPPCRSGRRR